MTPATTLDLAAPEVVADPYPFFAEERARGPVVWDEAGQRFLTTDHAAASAVLRSRKLGRVWRDREPTAYLEPFNLLHRNQMMENEPPDHTRLRRLVSGAFARGHVERMRPTVQKLATELLGRVDVADFNLIADYAEPLPVLVIAELLGVPQDMAPELRAWSQAIVRMYEPSPGPDIVAAAVTAADAFAAAIRDLARTRVDSPRADLISDLVQAREGASRLTEDEVVASAVLLLNAGHEASVNVFGNGAVAMLSRGLRPEPGAEAWCVEEMLRFDSALQLFERTALEDVEVVGVPIRKGQKIAALLGAAHRDPAVFEAADTFDVRRDPNPHLAFGAGLHFCLGAPLARMELEESLRHLFATLPDIGLVADPVSRGTFVLRGYTSVRAGS